MKEIMKEEACCLCGTKKLSVTKVMSWVRDLLLLLASTLRLHKSVLS